MIWTTHHCVRAFQFLNKKKKTKNLKYQSKETRTIPETIQDRARQKGVKDTRVLKPNEGFENYFSICPRRISRETNFICRPIRFPRNRVSRDNRLVLKQIYKPRLDTGYRLLRTTRTPETAAAAAESRRAFNPVVDGFSSPSRRASSRVVVRLVRRLPAASDRHDDTRRLRRIQRRRRRTVGARHAVAVCVVRAQSPRRTCSADEIRSPAPSWTRQTFVRAHANTTRRRFLSYRRRGRTPSV